MSVSRETRGRLALYADLLLRWTARINLISAADHANLWQRHFEDCLQLRDLLPRGIDRAVDLGSGAGFPGLVLAIATGIHFDLVEADHRKAAFLREAVRVTQAPAAVFASRVEEREAQPARLVTARALAPLPKLLSLASPFLTSDGHALFLKGASAAAELTEARKQWHMQVRQVPSRTSDQATIFDITGLHRVGSAP